MNLRDDDPIFDRAFQEIEKKNASNQFRLILDARNYLAVSYEQFTKNRDQQIVMYTDAYYAYHYFAYVNIFYSLKERIAQFINVYLSLGNPTDDVGYYRISKNLEAKKVFQKIFDFLADPVFEGVTKSRKVMSHHSEDYKALLKQIPSGDSKEPPIKIPTDQIDKTILDQANDKNKHLFTTVFMCIYNDVTRKINEEAAQKTSSSQLLTRDAGKLK
jgi:hypothetical protein